MGQVLLLDAVDRFQQSGDTSFVIRSQYSLPCAFYAGSPLLLLYHTLLHVSIWAQNNSVEHPLNLAKWPTGFRHRRRVHQPDPRLHANLADAEPPLVVLKNDLRSRNRAYFYHLHKLFN